MKILLPLLLAMLFPHGGGAESPPPLPPPVQSEQRPQLQFVNGTEAAMEIFWLKDENERVRQGSVPPGKSITISTTLGHRFIVQGAAAELTASVTSDVPFQAFRFGGVPAFYTQRIEAHGFPIVASARVNPYALKEAAYLLDLLLAARPDVRTAMIRSGARLCILAHDEFTCDLPDFPWFAEQRAPGFPDLSGRDYWNARVRGTGASLDQALTTCAEENLLGLKGDPYAAECIFVHEFAHAVHLRGLANLDPTFDSRLRQAYQAAMQAGRWQATYASTNHREYFAEGVQSWFECNRVNDDEHNDINTRARLQAYDPALAALCREAFGEPDFKYTKPATRLRDHLAGYEPASAPVFAWPERLRQVNEVIGQRVRARNEAARAQP